MATLMHAVAVNDSRAVKSHTAVEARPSMDVRDMGSLGWVFLGFAIAALLLMVGFVSTVSVGAQAVVALVAFVAVVTAAGSYLNHRRNA